ncbi:MAG: hypothetical protein J6Y03_05125, partial [Alphaproteobacteria bacterium]|nr:hypothetical protein [Alphaproteobacteria bacterium]
ACCEYGLRCGSNCCEPGQDCCAGECIEKVECPENQRYDSNACECRCGKDAAGMRLESDGKGGCKCPTDSNGRRMSLVNGYCTCVDAGFSVVGGNCKRMDCRDGTSGNTYQCYIDNVSCGYNCDSTGHNCGAGICHASDCREGETFVKKTRHTGGYNYACKKHVRNGYDCYYHKWGGWECYRGNTYCCDTNNTTTFECTTGFCGDGSRCRSLNTNYSASGDACVLSEDLICQYVNRRYVCFKHGYYCDYCSEEQIKSGTCCTGNSCKVSKDIVGTYNPETKRCEYTSGEDTVTCSTTQPTTLYPVQDCYAENGDKTCRVYVNDTIRSNANYAAGRCSEAEANCPEGTKYGYIEGGGYYDCRNETPDAPVCMYGDNKIRCFYKGALCGMFCDYFGRNCQRVYLPQCATAGHCPQNGYDITKNPCDCDGAVSSGLVKVKDANNNEIEEYHEFCCPAGHTYANGACAII